MPEGKYSGRPLIDKLGVKAGATVSVLGLRDAAFGRQLRARTPEVHDRLVRGSTTVLLGVTAPADLRRLVEIERVMARDGAVWVIHPRDPKVFGYQRLFEAGKRAGLVDVKIVRFSETHTGMKFVIPVARR